MGSYSKELWLETNPSYLSSNYPNGYTDMASVYDSLRYEAPTFKSTDMVEDEYMHGYCTNGQWWFNICIKAFTIIFSYINLLPVRCATSAAAAAAGATWTPRAAAELCSATWPRRRCLRLLLVASDRFWLLLIASDRF